MSQDWEASWIKGKRLGGGGQGETFLLTSREDENRHAVLKVLHPQGSEEERQVSRGRFKQEVSSLQILSGFGLRVPEVIDDNTRFFSDQEVELYLVMSYVPGPTLDTYVREKGTFDLSRAVAHAVELCRMFERAHTHKVLHRDLKPGNIIVKGESEEELFVVDFGLTMNTDSLDLTQASETMKNKFLALPEMVALGGDRRDRRSDIAAISAVFYFMLTGKNCGFVVDGSGTLPHRRLGREVPSTGNAHLDNAISRLLDKGLAQDFERRYPTAEALRLELERVLRVADGESLSLKEQAGVWASQIYAASPATQIARAKELTDPVFQLFVNWSTSELSQILGDSFTVGTTGEPQEKGKPVYTSNRFVVRFFGLQVHPRHDSSGRVYRYYFFRLEGEKVVVYANSVVELHKEKIATRDFEQVMVLGEYRKRDAELLSEDVERWLSEAMEILIAKMRS